jgi:hypothetical protein
VELGTVLGWKTHVGQRIGLGVIHQRGQLWHARACLISDIAPLLARGAERVNDNETAGLVI